MRPTRLGFVISLLLLCFSFVRADEPTLLSPAEGATAHGLGTMIQTFQPWFAGQEACPLAPGVLHSMVDVQQLLPSEKRNGIVVQDGWTRPFRAWCQGARWAVISFGADGEPGADYTLLPALGETGDDFVVIDGDFGAAPDHIVTMIGFGKQKRTMTDMRSVGIVFEAFRLDNNVFPGGAVAILEPVERILSDVQPVYIRTLPLIDAWGNTLRYWTDGSSYRIVSAGEDGVFETDYTSLPGAGEFEGTDFGRDIVFGNGEFEQWPGGEPAPES